MPIKAKIHIIRMACLLSVFFLCSSAKIEGQVVWENYRNEVYDYLARMAQKGLINFDDVIKPLSRSYIAKSL